MIWVSETPRVITTNDWILPILKHPIHWLRGVANVWSQYALYILNYMQTDKFVAKKLLNVYDLNVGDNEKIRVARTRHIVKPKLIVLYCHTVFGHYSEFAHLAEQFKNDPIVYFSYSRRGAHPDLSTKHYNITGSTDILDKILDHINSVYSNVPIHAIGASAGTCLLSKYLGSKNQSKRIKSAILISPCYNFTRSIAEIPASVQSRLLAKIKVKYAHCLNPTILNVNSLQELALHHYKMTEHKSFSEYIRNNDPAYFLNSINVPTVMISALDDFCFPGNITKDYYDLPQRNNNITMIITQRGGHISFNDYRSTVPWCSRVAIEYIKAKLLLL